MKKVVRTKFKNFHPRIRVWLARTLDEAETPVDFLDEIYSLTEKLKEFRYVEDEYRKNWHSVHCECDGCLEEEYGGEKE